MKDQKYKLNYDIINHLKELTNMTFNESKTYCKTNDINYAVYLRGILQITADLSFIEIVEFCFKDNSFDLDTLRKNILASLVYHKEPHINKTLDDMEEAILRCVLCESFKEVD